MQPQRGEDNGLWATGTFRSLATLQAMNETLGVAKLEPSGTKHDQRRNLDA